ncbi:MAG TPA: nitronate monooxygenase [Longimicrobiales bacterium]|nr:nitronate monooxygenase [Longimicrobiales bacterium]
MSAALAYPLPTIIQGGMGIGVSSWGLARTVSLCGQLGVVSGTAIDSLFVRRLQDGDLGGHLRRAMERFPLPDVSADALANYFLPDGRTDGAPYRLLSMWRQTVSRAREQITMLASFVEVHLAKEGHDGPVGINLLTKVQMPNLATLYGAMLAGVDYVLMGAGIPQEIPGALDAMAAGDPATMKLHVESQPRGEVTELRLDPAAHFDGAPPAVRRPAFLPIISAHSLATMLTRKANGSVEGFVIEGPTAGGHNAPPRGRLELDDDGQPIYGDRDHADLAAMRDLGLPFWLAGGTGNPERLEVALAEGAAGVQVGTLFALSQESGLDPVVREAVLEKARHGEAEVRTDILASPTGFPFKVLSLEGTNSEQEPYERRERVCDLGYLREPFRREDGRLDYRCAAEPVDTYVKKGGAAENTVGRKCLCNALMANVGHAQERADGPERAIVTTGDDLATARHLLAGRDGYSATDVVEFLLSRRTAAVG